MSQEKDPLVQDLERRIEILENTDAAGFGEEFDFKLVTAHQNLEDMGGAWDQFSESGWQKGNELFAGKVDCDSARSYIATNRRMAEDDGE